VIIAYHAIFTTYGTWLPNDPRGAFSRNVYRAELRALGRIRYGRQDPQPPIRELQRFWTAATPRLSRRPFFIDESQRAAIAGEFCEVLERLNVTVHACAIMNDHVHILLLRSKYRIEYLVGQLKAAATRSMGLKHTPWTRGCWKVFISDKESLFAAARYIEKNPVRAGLPAQHWSFVTPLSESIV